MRVRFPFVAQQHFFEFAITLEQQTVYLSRRSLTMYITGAYLFTSSRLGERRREGRFGGPSGQSEPPDPGFCASGLRGSICGN